MARFVLLDRDGVINRKIRNGYVTSWNELVFLPGALDALRLFRAAGWTPLVVSNQAGVGKGLMTQHSLDLITARFMRRIESNGGHVGKVYYCTHCREQRCMCRKPRPGLLLAAQRDFQFDFAETYLVGDSDSDLAAAASVGCPAILISGNATARVKGWVAEPAAVTPDLKTATEFILSHPLGANRRAQVVPGLPQVW